MQVGPSFYLMLSIQSELCCGWIFSANRSPVCPCRAMSSAPTTSPSVDKVDGFSRKSVRKAKQKRSQSSSQFRSQGKPIELTPLPLLKGKNHSGNVGFLVWDSNNMAMLWKTAVYLAVFVLCFHVRPACGGQAGSGILMITPNTATLITF